MPRRRKLKLPAQFELEHIYRTAPVGLCLRDTDLRCVRINEELARITGKTVEEHLGRTTEEVVPEIGKVVGPLYRRVLETGRSELNIEVTSIPRGNSKKKRTLLANIHPVLADDGTMLGVSAAVVDITQLKSAESELRRGKEKLRKQSRILTQKNAALRELLEQIGFEKKQMREDILSNVYELIQPVLSKLKQRAVGTDLTYLELLEHNVEELVAPFGKRISDKRWRLSPREKEVCNMIRDGFSTKEIAVAMSTSARTVDNHRLNVRKKMGIANKPVNLTSFLQSL